MVVGRALLILSLLVALWGIATSVYGYLSKREGWIVSGRRSVYVLAGLLTAAFGLLEAAFLRDDFSFQTVADHSSSSTPYFYKATAIWSSQEGSLLLWVWLLALWSSLVLAFSHRRLRLLAPYATAVLLGFSSFFCALLVFSVSPFQQSAPQVVEGVGLNPLLRHPSMMFHPPMLYTGYTLATVPFAFAIAALITRRVDATWISATRRFALAGWAFLGIGILLGARWSYAELGWGGYWAWDPVENAALMPWLTATAFLHSAMLQERRGILKVWNVSLVLATGILAILGTFLVRSGIIDSIHAFGASTLGVPFLILIGVLTAGSTFLILSRRQLLASRYRIDSLLSREAVFLLNNLALVGLCFVVMWGTFFPLISEAATGNKASVGPPWFSRYTLPLALILVLLSGIGPVIAWRRSSVRGFLRAIGAPLVAAILAVPLLGLFGVFDRPWSAVVISLSVFAVVAVLREFYSGARARRAITGEGSLKAVTSLITRNRRRYGGYIVHIGIALLFVGVAVSSAFQEVRELRLKPGQMVEVGDYSFRYLKATAGVNSERIYLGALLDVRKDGKRVALLRPNRGYYPDTSGMNRGAISRFFLGEATSEVGMKAGFRRDIWTAVQPDLEALKPVIDEADRRFASIGADAQAAVVGAVAGYYERKPPPATFRVMVSPLVSWIWLGGITVFLGALVALWPARRGLRLTAVQIERRESLAARSAG